MVSRIQWFQNRESKRDLELFSKKNDYQEGEIMQIANPIYDVVFKYLMEDNKIAKIMLSTIIDEKIISLEFLSKEKTLELEKKSLTVKIMDFSAKIKTPDGSEKQVIIELQKAKYASDILRFRRYLGGQYISKANIKRTATEDGEDEKPLPIISIYFLGHKLEHIKTPLIKVKRAYIDGTTGEEIKEREEFIECLSHDSFVIQIPHLRTKFQTEVEQLLSVFDQNNISDDRHFLKINPEDYPVKHRKIIRRLQQAAVEEDVRETMDLEDEIIGDLENLERKIQKTEEKLGKKEEELKSKDKELNENKKRLESTEKELENREKLIKELKMKLNHK